MIKCLNCGSEFEPKRETAKFCKDSCRVLWHRKNGKNKPVTKLQVQVLYEMALSVLEQLNKDKSTELPADYLNFSKVGVLQPNGDIAPFVAPKPQIALKSFDQWREKKRECESEEEWGQIKAGIEAATNLSRKQKDLLIKYS